MKLRILSKLFFFVLFFSVDTIFARVFFGEKIRDVLVTLIQNEQCCIKVAMYTFTDPLVAAALIKAHHRGVRVECVVDGFTNRITAGQGYYLRKNGIMAMQYQQKERTDLMHSKYFIFDKTRLYKKQPCSSCVMTGSYNCTHNATFNNFENTVILSEEDIINKYHKNFCKIKKESAVIPLFIARRQSRD